MMCQEQLCYAAISCAVLCPGDRFRPCDMATKFRLHHLGSGCIKKSVSLTQFLFASLCNKMSHTCLVILGVPAQITADCQCVVVRHVHLQRGCLHVYRKAAGNGDCCLEG